MSDIAINPVTRRVQFTGNTGTGPYAFNFNILQSSDIVVYKNNVLLTETTDYTVSIAVNGTGNITLTAALVLADILTIIGGRELSRTTDFVTAGDLLASSLNEQLDSNVIMSQQLDERFGRTIKAQPGDEDATLDLPVVADRANRILSFDQSGNLLASTASGFFVGANFFNQTYTGDGSTTSFALTVDPGTKNNIQVYIDGVYQNKATFSTTSSAITFTEAPPLNAAMEFIIGNAVDNVSSDANLVNYNQGGTGAQTRTVEAKLQDTVSVKDFGAVGDGVVDDAASIQKALDYIRDNATGGSLYFPTGTYKCNSVLSLVQSSSNNNKNWIIDGGGATLDFSSSGLTSGSLLNIGCTGTNFDFRERAITVVKNLKIIGPETGNAYVVSGPADHTPDGSTIGLDLGSLLNVTLQDVYVRRCFTGIRTQRVFPLNAFHVVATACTTGIKIEEGSTYGTWINCSTQASRHGIVIAPTVTDGGISNQTFYSQRVENCLRGVTVDQGVSSSGTSRQVRGIAFYSPYMESMAYDYFRLGKTWDVSVTSADSADRNAAYLTNVTIQGGRAEDPATSGFIIRSSANDFVNGCVLDIPAGNFSKITGNFALSKIFLQSRVDGGSEIGDIKFTNGTEIIANGGINLNTNASYIDFQGFNTAGSGTRLKTKLDYYEEASFTPNLWDNSSSSSEGQGYATQLGYYTRVGNMVSFNIRLIATSLGTLTTGDTARISLPLTSSATKERASVAISEVYNMSITSGQSVHGVISAGADYISLQLTDSALGYTGLLLSEFSATGEIAISGTYFV
jgi:hypothetical protein